MEPTSSSWPVLVDALREFIVHDINTFPIQVDKYSSVFNKEMDMHTVKKLTPFLLARLDLPQVLSVEFVALKALRYFQQFLTRDLFDSISDQAGKYDYANNIFLTLEALIRRLPEGCLDRGLISEIFPCFCSWMLTNNENGFYDARRPIINCFTQLIQAFEPTGRYLLLCRIYESLLNKDMFVASDTAFLAILIQVYHQNLEVPVFLSHLPFFYHKLFRSKYQTITEGVAYYLEVCALIKYQAMRRLAPEILRAVKVNLLDNFYEQFRDYVELETRHFSVTNPGEEYQMVVSLNLIEYSIRDALDSVKLYS